MSVLERVRQERQARQQPRYETVPDEGLASSAVQESIRPQYMGQASSGGRLPNKVYSPEEFRQLQAVEAEEARKAQLRREMLRQGQEQMDYQEANPMQQIRGVR